MLQPKKTKFRKQFRGKRRGIACSNNEVSFGEYGLKSVESAWVKANQIEAARRAITGSMKRKGKVWVKIFPDKPYTQKPNNSKMLGGKGEIEGYVVVVRPGLMMFEVSGISEEMAKEAMRLAAHKLPMKTKFVARKIL